MTMDPIRIQIPKELFSPAESAAYDGTLKLDAMTVGTDEYLFPNPIIWSIDITNTGGALLVTGTVEADARTQCVRCLEDADIHIDGEIEGYFLLSAQDAPPDDMDADEFDILPDDKHIDVAPLIQAAILLELPLVPICSEDCKGLCSTCGANLNTETCTCGDVPATATGANNPFGVLANLDLN